MRRAVAVLGWLTALLGWAAVAYDLFGPTYSVAGCDSSGACTSGTATLLQVGLTGTAAAFLAAVVVLFFGFGLGALALSAGWRQQGLTAITITLALLLLATVLSGLSVGYSFVPADLLAILTTVFAFRARPRGPAESGPAPTI